MDPVRPKDIGQGSRFHEILVGQAQRVGIDVVQSGPVDSDRSVSPSVVGVAGRDIVRQLVPVPQRETRIAALDGAVQVIPVIQHPDPNARCAHE